MQITYDVKLPEVRKHFGGTKSEEVLAIEAFIQGTAKNMCFSYDDVKMARRKLSTLSSFKKNNKFGNLIDYFRDDERIYIVRLSPAEVKSRRAKSDGLKEAAK